MSITKTNDEPKGMRITVGPNVPISDAAVFVITYARGIG